MLFPKFTESEAVGKDSIDDFVDGLPSDGRILAQGLAGRIKALTDDEGPPLTTKVIVKMLFILFCISQWLQAMRDLEAAQRTRVYSHTLIKVK